MKSPKPHLLVALAVLTFAMSAYADRYTETLDVLENKAKTLDVPPPGEDPPTKKDLKIYNFALKILAKPTASTKRDIMNGVKVMSKLIKSNAFDYDPDLRQIMQDIPATFEDGIRTRALAVEKRRESFAQVLVTREEASILSRAKKKIDRAFAALDRFGPDIDMSNKRELKTNMKLLVSADKQTIAAEKLMENLKGDVVDDCPGQAFAKGESASVTRNGSVIQFDRWEFEPVPQSGDRWFRLYRCDPPVRLELLIRFPQLGQRKVEYGRNTDEAIFDEALVRLPVFHVELKGANNVTVWDNFAGAITAAFSFANETDTFTNGTLVLTNFYR